MYDKFDVVVHPVSELRGELTAQPSKNYTTRYLIAAALSGSETLVRGVATSEDSHALQECLKTWGAELLSEGRDMRVNGFGNRPLDQHVADLLPEQDLGPLGRVPVFIGGPVATDKLAFASMHWNRKKGTLRCQTHLSVADALHELSMGHEVRGFVGYAGWSEGQLEGELRRRSWITSPPRKAILAGDKSVELWSDIMEAMGPLYMLMAHTPEKVHLN